jgi:aconitase A
LACREKAKLITASDIDLDLADVQPSVAGPKRPQDRIDLPELGRKFRELLEKPVHDGGYGKKQVDLREKHVVELNGSAPRDRRDVFHRHEGDQGISPAKHVTCSRWLQTDRHPIRAKKSKLNRAKCSYMGVLTLATAAS